MAYWIIEPEVAGGLGKGTKMNSSVHPPIVSHLHYEFDDWLGDDLVESFPCFIVTDRLGRALEKSDLTGWRLKKVLVTTSAEFRELHPALKLPEFHWLVVEGAPGSDFWVDANNQLELTDRAWEFLQQFNVRHASVSLAG
jgi:hypothetical protein